MSAEDLQKAIQQKLSQDDKLKVDYDYEKFKKTFEEEMQKLQQQQKHTTVIREKIQTTAASKPVGCASSGITASNSTPFQTRGICRSNRRKCQGDQAEYAVLMGVVCHLPNLLLLPPPLHTRRA